MTPLHRASRYENVEVVRMLIERGADVSAQNKEGGTPLHQASQNGSVGVVRMLLERSTNIAARNKDGETPLHLASKPLAPSSYWPNVHLLSEVSRMLLEQGADVSARNKAGLTPLRLALQSPDWQDTRAQVLLEYGADPSD
jgi:ankyrin repeat protein